LSNDSECIGLAEDFSRDHTVVLNDLIRSVLSQAKLSLEQLNAIAVNEGPGSYTALRIGVVTAKGLSYALDKPLILVPGLKIIANAAREQLPGYSIYLSMVDARRDEVYLSAYNDQLEEILSPQSVILNGELVNTLGMPTQRCVIAGTGALKWSQYVDNWPVKQADLTPSARQIIPLSMIKYKASDFTETAQAKPFYLKLPNITTPKEKLITP
jgi:tRNA threonylcarbamoyladenosine biosynthesis protein TsaB